MNDSIIIYPNQLWKVRYHQKQYHAIVSDNNWKCFVFSLYRNRGVTVHLYDNIVTSKSQVTIPLPLSRKRKDYTKCNFQSYSTMILLFNEFFFLHCFINHLVTSSEYNPILTLLLLGLLSKWKTANRLYWCLCSCFMWLSYSESLAFFLSFHPAE